MGVGGKWEACEVVEENQEYCSDMAGALSLQFGHLGGTLSVVEDGCGKAWLG
jgi:hypothetical protein